MKNLIIAEKPSLMRTIVKALSSTGEVFHESKDKEYQESSNYVATAQFGHLLELRMPEEYEERKGVTGPWRVETLPFFPKKYQYKVKEGVNKRYKTIQSLIERNDIECIVHCGDPDREGQILIDLVLRQLGNTKPVIRPQLKALTDSAIVDAFDQAKDNALYKNVFNEGMTRMCFDWDFGINLSQYATVKTGARPALNIGRVIGAICTEIYRRDVEIENFVPETYFKVVSDIPNGFKLTSSKTFPKESQTEAEAYAKELQKGPSVVDSITEKKVEKKRPKLFSQTTLQAAMSKLFGWKPDKTLDIAQSLYEKGLATYPRTNTEYVSEDEKGAVEAVVNKLNKNGALAFRDDKTVFDNKKIEGHSAITITGKKPDGLTKEQMECYQVILNRFLAVFCNEPCEYNKTIVVINNPKEQFKVSGEVPITLGWQSFDMVFQAKKKKKTTDDDDNDDSGRVLPKVSKGDVVETDFHALTAQTKPPKHYTVESLGKWMENPFRKEDADEEEDYKAVLAGLQIGTEATRAGILKKAEEKKYISIKKKSYRIEPRGRFLVEACQQLGIDFSKEMTANMGKALKDVGKGEAGIMDVLTTNRDEIRRIITEDLPVITDSPQYGGTGDYVVKDKAKGTYAPTGEEIAFNKKWGSHSFTQDEINALLNGEEISFQATSLKGNVYTATGSLQKQKYKGKSFWGFKLKEKEFPPSWCGHTFTDDEVELLQSGKSITAEDFVSNKTGKTFSCELKWKNGVFNPKFPKKP